MLMTQFTINFPVFIPTDSNNFLHVYHKISLVIKDLVAIIILCCSHKPLFFLHYCFVIKQFNFRKFFIINTFHRPFNQLNTFHSKDHLIRNASFITG